MLACFGQATLIQPGLPPALLELEAGPELDRQAFVALARVVLERAEEPDAVAGLLDLLTGHGGAGWGSRFGSAAEGARGAGWPWSCGSRPLVGHLRDSRAAGAARDFAADEIAGPRAGTAAACRRASHRCRDGPPRGDPRPSAGHGGARLTASGADAGVAAGRSGRAGAGGRLRARPERQGHPRRPRCRR